MHYLNKKKILYITYDGLTDPLGQSQVLPYLINLSKGGYAFTILSFEKKERYGREKENVIKMIGDAPIQWVALFFTKNPPIISKIYDRWKLKRKAHELYRMSKFNMVHCRSYVASEAGLDLKKRYNIKFLFDMRGLWADEKVDSGQWNQNIFLYRLVYKHYKKKEKDFLMNADGIISLTEAAKKEILSKKGFVNLSIRVIPCCADLELFDYNKVDNADINKLKEDLGLSNEAKIITYLGSIGGWYLTNEMFIFYKQLLEKYPEFVLLFLTKDNPEFVNKQAMKNEISENKIIVKYVEREKLPLFLALSNISIFFIRPTYSKIASSPTKHAELMGMGIPVICNSIGDTGNIILHTKTGILVKEFNPEHYKYVITYLPDLLRIPKEQIRSAAHNYFDLDSGSKEYLQVYNNILDEKLL